MGGIVRFSRRRKRPTRDPWQHKPRPPRQRRPRGRLPVWFPLAALIAFAGLAYLYQSWSLIGTKLPFTGVRAAASSALIGRASVIDGDTIQIHDERIRFNGIDAPESAQLCQDGKGQPYRCGAFVANALDEFLAVSRPTRCEFVERDQHDRFVGDCFRADGVGVAASLVRAGMALDWPRYSGGAYAAEQDAAKADRIGLWEGTFQPPWEWRSEQRQDQPAQIVPLVGAPTTGAPCNIKGNVSERGERIYHVPGQEYYAATRITETRGERWFCSEREARSAGWRKSKL